MFIMARFLFNYLYMIIIIYFEISLALQDIPALSTTHSEKNKIVEKDKNNGMIHLSDGSYLLQSASERMLLSSGHNRLEIFCYKGESPNFSNLLKTVELRVFVPNDNFQYYEGANASAIHAMFEDSWFTFSPWKSRSFHLNLYNNSCLGIATEETFRISLVVRYVDFWRLLLMCGGVSLFIFAPLLAHNIIFHYVTGMSLGICGSLLIIIYQLSHLIPKKTGALSVMVGGWGLVLYFVQFLWLNSLYVIREYHALVIGYVVVVGLISFALVYRYGPLTDEKSISLVKWSLQLVGLGAIFFSCQCREFTFSVVLLILAHYNIPQSWKTRFKTSWLRYFPPKQRLLSEQEYLEQSRIETKRALEDLREFCHSPKCNAWKTMSRLQSPQRFAEFVEGGSHLSDNEMLAYVNSTYDNTLSDYITDDEEDYMENKT